MRDLPELRILILGVRPRGTEIGFGGRFEYREWHCATFLGEFFRGALPDSQPWLAIFFLAATIWEFGSYEGECVDLHLIVVNNSDCRTKPGDEMDARKNIICSLSGAIFIHLIVGSYLTPWDGISK